MSSQSNSFNKFDNLRKLILNSKQPIVFKNYLNNWKLLYWPISKWCQFNQPLTFRCGTKKCSKMPIWESSCTYKELNVQDFLEIADVSSEEWMYFDYKHLAELGDHAEFNDLEMPWKYFGFEDQGFDQTTIWIGNTGAHTSCHADTYGCNLVAQVIGRKQWILFPHSDEHITNTITRVPYEESSIYSNVNFYCGQAILDSKVGNSQPYIVTLKPGDVLFVPNKWWHYVEHLSTALSVNTWIPLKGQESFYLDECLVRYLVSRFTEQLSYEEKKEILNPNETIMENTFEGLNQINYCVQQYIKNIHTKDFSTCSKRKDFTTSSDTKDFTRSETKKNTSSDIKDFTMSSETKDFTSDSDFFSDLIKIINKDFNGNIIKVEQFTKEKFQIFCKNKCKCIKNHKKKNDHNDDEVRIKKIRTLENGPNTTSISIETNTSSIPIETNTSSIPIETNTSSILIETNTSSIPIETNTSSIPIKTNTSSISIETNTSSIPIETNTSSIPIETNTSSIPIETNTSSIPIETNTSSIPIKTNTSSIPIKTNTSSISIETNTSSIPIETSTSSIPIGTNKFSIPIKTNTSSIPIEINTSSTPIEISVNNVIIQSSHLINAFTHPDVIALVKLKLLEQLNTT